MTEPQRNASGESCSDLVGCGILLVIALVVLWVLGLLGLITMGDPPAPFELDSDPEKPTARREPRPPT